MNFRLLKYQILVVLLMSLISGCAIGPQLRWYTNYSILDLKVTEDGILVVLEKHTWRYRTSLGAAVMGENQQYGSSKKSYRFVVFDKEDAQHSKDFILKVAEVKEIASNIESMGDVPIRICDKEKLITSDIINRKHIESVICVNDAVTVHHISEDPKTTGFVSYDGCTVFYKSKGKNYLYSCVDNNTQELEYTWGHRKTNEGYIKTVNSADNKDIFIEYMGGYSKTAARYIIVDKSDGTTISQFDIPSLSIQDFHWDGNESNFLTSDFNDGFVIYNINGKPLYKLEDPSSEYMLKAVLYGNKMYAVGQRHHEEEFRYSRHLELLIWDYENDTTITKFIPVDSQEFDW